MAGRLSRLHSTITRSPFLLVSIQLELVVLKYLYSSIESSSCVCVWVRVSVFVIERDAISNKDVFYTANVFAHKMFVICILLFVIISFLYTPLFSTLPGRRIAFRCPCTALRPGCWHKTLCAAPPTSNLEKTRQGIILATITMIASGLWFCVPFMDFRMQSVRSHHEVGHRHN